jgi:cell division transport system permease protein
MRFSFFLREALRGLRRSSAPALAALLTVVITALVLGVFIPIVQATTGTANEVRNRVVVDAYLKNDVTESDRVEVQRELEGTPGVKSVEYISKDEALRELGRKVNDAEDKIELLGSNPLPSLFRITPEDPDELKAIVAQIAPGGTPRLDAIDDVQNRESDTGKILSATGLVKGLGAVMAGLLILASIALIANTIRLSVFARRREVEVMKLVGATNWFIRWPFVIEGVIVGFLARDRQDHGRRPAVGPLRPVRRARHDRLPSAGRAAAVCVRGRLGDRQRHHAAPLPPRLAAA